MSDQSLPTGLLMQEYRETLLALGANPTEVKLRRRADVLEAEVNRRVAW